MSVNYKIKEYTSAQVFATSYRTHVILTRRSRVDSEGLSKHTWIQFQYFLWALCSFKPLIGGRTETAQLVSISIRTSRLLQVITQSQSQQQRPT